MAEHASQHCKIKNNKSRGKIRTLSVAGLLAGGLALLESVVLATATAAAPPPGTVIFTDGHNYPDSGHRMLYQLSDALPPGSLGFYQVQNANCAPAPCLPLSQPAATTTFLFVQYPATLGLLDGPGAKTGDQSVNIAQQGLETELNKYPPSADNPVTVVAYSEGAVAASHEVPKWGPNSNIAFVLIADPERPNGGILSRFPAGTYIPFVGITAGSATHSNGAPIVMVTRQYDGVADAPAYPINVLADANAFLGFYYLHGTYQSVNPNDPNNIVTTSPDGLITDVLVPAPEGQLPIFMPLAQAGVPAPILVALDPAVRALIETGYDGTTDPSQRVRFGLLPPPSAWPGDVQMVVVGFIMTGERLPGALLASIPGSSTLPGTPTLPGNPTLPVLAPLLKALPTSPSPGANLSSNVSVPQGEPTSQSQQNVLVSQQSTSNPAPDAGTQPSTSNSGSSSTDQSQPGPVQPQVTKPMPKPPFTIDMATGGKFGPGTTDTGGGASSSVGKPLQSAVTNVTNAIRSVTGSLAGSTSTGGSSSPSKSGSAGEVASHG